MLCRCSFVSSLYYGEIKIQCGLLYTLLTISPQFNCFCCSYATCFQREDKSPHAYALCQPTPAPALGGPHFIPASLRNVLLSRRLSSPFSCHTSNAAKHWNSNKLSQATFQALRNSTCLEIWCELLHKLPPASFFKSSFPNITPTKATAKHQSSVGPYSINHHLPHLLWFKKSVLELVLCIKTSLCGIFQVPTKRMGFSPSSVSPSYSQKRRVKLCT